MTTCPLTRRCRHCRVKPVSRSRGLCWKCFHTPAVLALHPVASKYASKGVGFHGRGLPEPTDAVPGSPEKLAVLEERARLGLCLWHPDDPKVYRVRARRASLAVLLDGDE